jgi:hypothetical protein
MSSADEHHQREDLENQVWNAISAFEQIVETIPNDRVSLEALSSAYEQVGDLARARGYLVRLVNVLVDEGDREAASLLHDRLLQHAVTDPLAKEAEARLEAMLTAGKPAPRAFELAAALPEVVPGRQEEVDLRSSHVAAELSFAWALFQADQLTQEEYAQVAQDLSDVSASNAVVTVSLLHVLHDRVSRSLDRIIAYSAQEAGMPIIPLSLFDVPETAFDLLPTDFMVRYGVMVFALLGKDALVVILNPQNKAMKAKVEQMLKKRCHFYLTTPADFDTALEKLKKAKRPVLAAGLATP